METWKGLTFPTFKLDRLGNLNNRLCAVCAGWTATANTTLPVTEAPISDWPMSEADVTLAGGGWRIWSGSGQVDFTEVFL